MVAPFFVGKAREGWRIAVWVQPGAKKTELAGMHGEFLKIRLRAPAVDNKANAALTEFVAKVLGVRPSLVRLDAGQSSRKKVVSVLCEEEPDWSRFFLQA